MKKSSGLEIEENYRFTGKTDSSWKIENKKWKKKVGKTYGKNKMEYVFYKCKVKKKKRKSIYLMFTSILLLRFHIILLDFKNDYQREKFQKQSTNKLLVFFSFSSF